MEPIEWNLVSIVLGTGVIESSRKALYMAPLWLLNWHSEGNLLALGTGNGATVVIELGWA